jgi:hypothetical protein
LGHADVPSIAGEELVAAIAGKGNTPNVRQYHPLEPVSRQRGLPERDFMQRDSMVTRNSRRFEELVLRTSPMTHRPGS